MLERDDENDLDVEENSVHDLKKVAFLLKGLYGQLNEEREAIYASLAITSALYAEYEVLVDIHTLEVIRGTMPRRA